MPAIHYHRHQVRDDEIDAQGHVNNLRYLQWAVDAAVAHSALQGWDSKRYQAGGGSWVVRSHEIHYHAPCFAGQQVVVATWVAGFRRLRSLRKYRILRADDRQRLAEAQTWWAYVAIPSMAPRRVPDELRDAFEIVDGDPELDWQ